MELLAWLPTAAIGALGFVLWAKLEAIEERQRTDQAVLAKQLKAIQELMQTELRTMDVRIARIESHLWPERIHLGSK